VGRLLLASGLDLTTANPKGDEHMLMLTEDAIQAVRGLVSSPPTVPDDAGLRIVGQREGEAEIGLQLELAEAPAEDDQVIEEEGARVFLEPEAAAFLEDKVLDATVAEDSIRFGVAPQQ
jgi:iron-sulfur cluster assembly protein